MGTRYEASLLSGPGGTGGGGGGGSTDSGKVTLGELYRPMKQVWPAVDATNGPLTGDAAITATAPSTTGHTYYEWSSSGHFNTQSQKWISVPSLSGAGCANVATPRDSTVNTPTHIDTGFVTESDSIIVAYQHEQVIYQGLSIGYHEIAMFAEHEGVMKGIRSAPAAFTGGTGGTTMYKTYNFKDYREREFRMMLSSNCRFRGIWVKNTCTVEAAPNRILCAYEGDSWRDGTQNVFAPFGFGNGSISGVTYPGSASLLYSNEAILHQIATGFAGILMAQGATGYFAANGASTDPASTGATPSVFLSTGRVNYLWDNWGDRKPFVFIEGSYNDGGGPTAPYQSGMETRALIGYDKLIAKDADIPIMVAGIQPKAVVLGNNYELSNRGLRDAVDARPGNCIGFIDHAFRWNDTQRGPKVGPDTLHETMLGADNIGTFWAKASSGFQVDRSWIQDQLTWEA